MVRRALLAALSLAWACDAKVAPDAGADPADAGAPSAEVGPRDAGFARDAIAFRPDLGLVVHHDAGAPPSCTSTCDCPQGLGCISGVCRTAGLGPVWCCANPGCPEGAACLNAAERPSSCPAAPDAGPDAGPRDFGAGSVGSACTSDMDCDQANNLTCWEQSAPPFLWDGYCTVQNCQPSCPPSSICVTFNGQMPVQGCLRTCQNDDGCRSDAYCFQIPNSTVRICLPDCRDDLFDCAPRTGEVYCSRSTGRCEMTPMQSATARVGDPCSDSRDCGQGQVCLGETAWGFGGGLCTRVCSGLAEATPCGMDERCQQFAGIGMCFRNCVNNACPNRVGAFCGSLEASWLQPSCIP